MTKNKQFTNYLLNVDSRTDRLFNASNRFAEIGQSFTRVSAITGSNLVENGFHLITRPNTEANWRSIQKIFKMFLESGDKFCFVFEDDVVFNPGYDLFSKCFHENFDQAVDVLQFGFLTFDGRNDDRKKNIYKVIRVYVVNLILARLKFVKFFSKCGYLANGTIFENLLDQLKESEKRILMQKQLGLKHPLIRAFEPGTHGFIISRRMAQLVCEFNLPMIMSADLVFMTLAKNPQFNIYRLGFPLASQDDTTPSINGHASKNYDLAFELLGK
jgi:GR25 family glycosyltransferase involved in LPS biosynthesis